ncbi:MAG TPA: sulfotransferase [Pedococcus sp.]|nr:sulfotransferase [Pedococcus sp.]
MTAADAHPERESAHRPILVTGVPRSGTTWLARLLAHAPRTALAGREPMNPRAHQFALAGTLTGWTRLTRVTPRQRLALVTSYRGLNPLVYSRYGQRQWAAPLPRTSVVVKDPFAMASLATVHDITDALPVLLVRHPGAVLSSYRRMGWSPDLDEIAPLALEHLGEDVRPSGDAATDMAVFWSTLHRLALLDLRGTGAVVVFHDDLALGGTSALEALFRRCGLDWNHRVAASTGAAWERKPSLTSSAQPGRLHDFDRAPQSVAAGWRAHVSPAEVAVLDRRTHATWSRLQSLRLDVSR